MRKHIAPLESQAMRVQGVSSVVVVMILLQRERLLMMSRHMGMYGLYTKHTNSYVLIIS